MSERRNLVIFGDRTAEEVYEAALLSMRNDFAMIERLYYAPETFRLNEVARLESGVDRVYYHVGMANESLKMKIVCDCEQIGWEPISIIHPSAQIASTARLEAGVYVGPCAVISSHAHVAAHAIIHIHSSVGHDSRVGRYSAVLPGARISGNVTVGERVLIGSNAFINAGVKVGNDCRVDALSYVREALPDGYIISPRSVKPLPRVDLPRPGRQDA
jgi:UDP-3-O-[3-hydroxymyristoyl] glucosamine N-acyltransferase